jgi:hypothetical protein
LPLKESWSTLDATRKQRWLKTAVHMQHLSLDARARVHERMVAWAKLTPTERNRARLGYLDARQVPSAERQRKWSKYQSLPIGPSARAADVRLATAAPAVARISPGATTIIMTRRLGAAAQDVSQSALAPPLQAEPFGRAATTSNTNSE